MRVVVTGSGGRVGRAICHALAARGHSWVGIDRLPASTAVHHVGDICDPGVLDAAMRGVDAVIHVAALHAPHVGVVPDAEFERINVDGTRAVIAAARSAGVGRLVFTSTTALYGRTGWIDEDTPPAPRTIYHRTKLAAEQLVREVGARIIRMSRCFPEPANLMAVYRLHRGVDARDVAAAHVLAVEHGTGGTWIVSGATPFARADIAELAIDAPTVLRARVPGLAAALVERRWRMPREIDRVYDASRAMRELGFAPRYGYEEVLALADAHSVEVLPPA